MARPIVLDTSALILASRGRGARQRLTGLLHSHRALVSAVTIAELYAGTRSGEEADLLDRFFTFFTRSNLILTPDASDWELAGRLICRQGRLTGEMRARDHLNDALVTICAGRVGGTVLTANPKHMGTWAAALRSSGLDVMVAPG